MKELFDAVRKDDFNSIEKLIENGVKVNIKDCYDKNPLFYVYDYKIAKLLINNGADVNAQDLYNNTPLHYAAHVGIAELLVENGADIDIKGITGNTPSQYTSDALIREFLENHKNTAYKNTAIRGINACAIICDEIAFWNTADNNTTDNEPATDCNHDWVESEGFRETYVDCRLCGRKQEDVV